MAANHNIFREAKLLLDRKAGPDMTQDERDLIAAAEIPLTLLPEFSDIPISKGLEAIARLVEKRDRKEVMSIEETKGKSTLKNKRRIKGG